MKKNAQITLIIAIGVFILIMASLILYLAYYFKIKNSAEPLVFEKISIENYINGCVKKTSEDGLVLLGRQGGLILLQDYLETPDVGIEYSLMNNQNKVPSIEKMQDELSFYMKNNLDVCLKGFEDFKNQGWVVEKSDIEAKTQVNEHDVAFDVDYPIKVSDKGSTISFDRFTSRLNVRLKYIHAIVDYIVEFTAVYKNHIDLTSLNEYNVNVTAFFYDSSLVYVLEDPKSLITSEPYKFIFALKLD